ncbi:hypothetical protein BC332_06407 [Capsicum chinense]|nr:hypothetical protein BC332_06407 [Capsicum chinense]
MIVVSSAKLAKEVLKTQDLVFCNRPSLLGQQKLSYNGHDIAFSPYNDYWREMRKICVLQLFSLKKVQSFRPIREDEVSSMIKKISQQAASSQVTNLSNIMISLTSIIICRVAFGVRFDEEAHERKRFDYLLAEAQAIMASFFVSGFFSSLSWIDKLTGLMNVLVAGSDTSAAIVVWAMTALVKNPKAMKKVQEEIRNLIGNKGVVNEDDIQNMSYLKAVIKETFRLYPPDPLLLLRESMKKSRLEGYEIQPGTLVHVNAWAIARETEIWKNPTEFIPERFLNSNIDFKREDYELIPFGAGRRGCPGITLGIVAIELALSNLLYPFDWELPYGLKKEDIDTDVELKDVIWGIVNEAGKINLVDVFPILENIDPQRIRYRTSIHFAKLFKLFGDLINERLKETKKNHSAENPKIHIPAASIKEEMA